MLFDLRGAGRRRTVQAIYLGLAILMGGGLVLFGVGGNVGGGLLDAVKGNGSGGSSNTFEKRVQQLEKRTRLNPKDSAAWLALTRARYSETTTGDNYDQATSAFTPKGLQALRTVEQSWDSYLALNPKKPDANVANLMVQAFGPSGLNEPAKAVSAMEIVVDARKPSYALYAQLAQLAYAAGQTRKGDLSVAKSLALAPKDQRDQLKQQLDQIKAQSAAAAAQGATSGPAPTATTG
jgi:hypothetical protein